MGKKTPEKINNNITPKIADESKLIKKSSSNEAGKQVNSKPALKKRSSAVSEPVIPKEPSSFHEEEKQSILFETIPKEPTEIGTDAIRRLIRAIKIKDLEAIKRCLTSKSVETNESKEI